MARNGSGTYSLITPSGISPRDLHTQYWNKAAFDDIATALTGSVAANGETTMTGDLKMGGKQITGASYWDDLTFPAVPSLRGVNDKPDFSYTQMGLLFPQNDTSEYIIVNVPLPHRWKEGSTIFPHVHIQQIHAGPPVFKMDYRWTNIGDDPGVSWTTYTMSTLAKTYTSGTIHQLVTNATGISGAGKTISSQLQLKLYRDDDVYIGDCCVWEFDIHIECDTLGSRLETTK